MGKKREEKKEEELTALTAEETRQAVARRMIASLRTQLDRLERLLTSEAETGEEEASVDFGGEEWSSGRPERVVEGVFDGENMVGEDGERYSVPPNYASKSKLVEGDLLRLTITDNGRFLFKQRGPIERQRLVGTLMQDERTGDWKVQADGRKYRALTASITYFHGEPGDEAVILVPKNAPSRWAAVENVIKQET
jgi:hypothetical protein